MIYAVQPITGGPVKIGTTEDLPTRLATLEGHYRQPLALLATLPGGPDEERAIHDRFAHLRFGRTEQFRPAADLLAFFGQPLLVDANPDAAEAMPTVFPGDPDRRTAKLAATVLGWAKVVSKLRGVSLAEYLTETLRDPVKADFTAAVETMHKQMADDPKGKAKGKGGEAGA